METHEQNDIERAKHMIAAAARDAVDTIASAAAQAVKVTSLQNSNDHDAFIDLVGSVRHIDEKFTEKFAEIRDDIKEIKDGTASRIACLEAEKLDVKDSYPLVYRKGVEDTLNAHELMIADHSHKITQILAYGSAMLVGMAIIEFLVNIYFKFGKL
jgi:MoxR-like ATPase